MEAGRGKQWFHNALQLSSQSHGIPSCPSTWAQDPEHAGNRRGKGIDCCSLGNLPIQNQGISYGKIMLIPWYFELLMPTSRQWLAGNPRVHNSSMSDIVRWEGDPELPYKLTCYLNAIDPWDFCAILRISAGLSDLSTPSCKPLPQQWGRILASQRNALNSTP